jgi:hypothetical protein
MEEHSIKRATHTMTTRTAIFLTLLICLAAATSHAATYAGGAGSSGDPWLISTVQDLIDISNPANSAGWDKHFRMTNIQLHAKGY